MLPKSMPKYLFGLAGLYLLSRVNYLLFHTLAEGFAIIIAALIFIMADKTYKFTKNNYLLFIGIAYSFVAVLDFLHLASYKGMGIFADGGPNPPTQFWVAARFMEAVSLFAAPYFLNRRVFKPLVNGIYVFITGLIVISILWLKVFPDCFIEGQGLTLFKVSSEFLVMLILLVGLVWLHLKKDEFPAIVYKTMSATLLLTVLSELSFTLYNDVYGGMNFIGHLFKVVSFVLVYKGIIQTGMEDPFENIFIELKLASITDPLTGVYNRRYFIDKLEEELERARRGNGAFSVIMLDIDFFKTINDEFGHHSGDLVLKRTSELIKNRIRKIDVFARWGGEEFILLVPETPEKNAVLLAAKLREYLSNTDFPGVGRITASFGVTGYRPGDKVDSLVHRVDVLMYEAKADGRDCVKYTEHQEGEEQTCTN